MKIVIEVDHEKLSEATIRRQLADLQRRLTAAEDDPEDDGEWWAGLETPRQWYRVTRIVGVAVHPAGSLHLWDVLPLEGKGPVEP